ncbi:hypothetical protein RB195_009599 [Necator americanus]|uniref:S1 RNA binding domain protein n=1 Tax=Necator americanus TaxID=51031 RepID=A0ABR1CU17_NECAM
MGVLDKEIDFPRGGAPIVPKSRAEKSGTSQKSHNEENQLFGVTKKRKSRGTAGTSSEVPAKKRIIEEKAAVWSKPISLDLLTEGVMGLGVVIEIHEDYVLMETADSCRVRLPATQVSKKFTDMLKQEKVSLESSFIIGQLVPFRVIQRSSQIEVKKRSLGGKKKTTSLPIVSCDPTKLNAHLSPATLIRGLVLHATVESVEEKGALLDIGLQSVQAFLPGKNQQRPVEQGQPVLVRVDSTKSSRVIVVTSFVEQDNLSLEACENLQLNHLMPGTIVECEPDPEPAVTAGIYVTLGNGVRGFVAKSHLPPRLRSDITRVGRALRCVVMFCQQNTPLLVLSAHPDIVAISKPEKRSSFLGYSIGDRVKCTVIDVVPQTFLVCFSLPVTDDSKVPLVTAIAYKKYLNKPEEIESFYSIGSEHMCRIMNFRYADRCMIVSTRKDMLAQKVVSYKDVVPGELMDAKVTDIHPRGVQVSICETVKGFIPADHASDKAVALEKAFHVGSTVKCRVWFVNEEKKQAWLTARQSLVNYKGTLISSYDSKYEGAISVGIIVKVLPTGGALLQFFGTVRGLLAANEARKLGNELKMGQVLEVRVTSVDPLEKKMVLALLDDSQVASGHVLHPKEVDFCSDGKHVFTAVIDEVTESLVGGRRSERAMIRLESQPSIKGSLAANLVSDSLDSPVETMGKVFRSGMKVHPVSPLGSLGGMNRFTSKRLVCAWLETFRMNVPKSFDDLKQGQIVCGIILQRVDDNNCLYVELAGGAGLIGKVAYVDVDEGLEGASRLQIGQTVVGRIRSIHHEKKTFRVSLKLADCSPGEHLPSNSFSPSASLALHLLRCCVEEICVFAQWSTVKLPAPGSHVVATISQIVDEVLFVTFNGKQTGFVRKGNHNDDVKVGNKIKCVVIDYVFPRNDAELVMVDSADVKVSKAKKKREESDSMCRVVLVKRDYICVLPSTKKCLVFVPSRFHPNQVVEVKNARVSVGDNVKISDPISLSDNLCIGFLDGDANLISKLFPAPKLQTFPGKRSESKDDQHEDSRKKTKSELGLRTKSVKNLGVYTGVVVGPWNSDDRNDHGKLAVEIELPGGNIGRLHASELPSRLLMEHSSPLDEFIRRNLKKNVVVKIINFVAIKKGDQKVRVAELTMAESKMSESRKKASAVAFQTVFSQGDVVRCFVSPHQNGKNKNIRVEVNPLWSGQIAHEAVSDDLKVKAPEHDGEVFEYLPKAGEMRMAKVLSAVKKPKAHRHGILTLAFDMQADTKTFEPGQRLTARVTHVNHNPLSVQFHLANGQQAVLCATAIANNYEKVHLHMEHFKRDSIFHLYALRKEHNPMRNYVVAEGRYESYLKQKENNNFSESRRLIVDRKEVVPGLTCDGFVVKHMPDAIFVEIGPGILGRIRKIHYPEITTIPLNSIITVKVRKIDAQGRISLALVTIVVQAETAVKDRKRLKEEDVDIIPTKYKKQDPLPEAEKIPLPDPGFDWSNTGFRPEDLAAVGKLGDDGGAEGITTDNLDHADEPKKLTEVKKERVKDVKSMTKEEHDMEKERRLIHREVELSGDLQPETQEDFARLLRKDPNCAELWIRYISFFLEKNDLTKARATAERALTVINYREEAEIFNIWTAYLNMEVAYGDEVTTKEVFQRACSNADSLKVHKQMAAIFSEADKVEEADEIYETMVKKFRANSDDVWTLFGEHLMSTDRAEKARDLMKRALTSVPKQRHVPLISRFAQMEFRKGDLERGCTLFESLVTAYPKKTDVWIVYADLCLKHSGIEAARQVLERACALPLSIHKLRPLFRRWMEAEQRHGDEKSRQLIREKAEKFLESSLDDMGNIENLNKKMVTSDSSLVIDSSSPYGRIGPAPPTPSSRTHALFSLSRFRSRLGTEMNEIIPNLYLGSLRDATDVDQLKKHRIQYIVSVHDLTAHHPAHENLKVLKIQLSDCSSADISSHFATTNQFIHNARLKQAAVLVHCLAGVSRSATVVVAYLMTLCDMSFFNALTFLSKKRPVINPNFGFRMQLCTFADRNMLAERQRLREHFGALACLSDLLHDETRLMQASVPLSLPAAVPVALQKSSEGDFPPKSESVRAENGDSLKTHLLPIRKVIARALPLPQSMRVQLSSLVHNPSVPELGFIDE